MVFVLSVRGSDPGFALHYFQTININLTAFCANFGEQAQQFGGFAVAVSWERTGRASPFRAF